MRNFLITSLSLFAFYLGPCVAANAADGATVKKESFLLKYAVLMLEQDRMNSPDPSRFIDIKEVGYKYAKIKSADGITYYEIVLPRDAAGSYFVIFKEDFASKDEEPIDRGFATGGADTEINQFRAYDGKDVDFGEGEEGD